jgi:hypothetical protein
MGVVSKNEAGERKTPDNAALNKLRLANKVIMLNIKRISALQPIKLTDDSRKSEAENKGKDSLCDT